MKQELKIKQLELELALLRAKTKSKPIKAKSVSPVAKCKAWVKAKRGGDFIKASKGSYTLKDGTTKDCKVLNFSNGETYKVGTAKFWKVRWAY